jgi:hypothetical protein
VALLGIEIGGEMQTKLTTAAAAGALSMCMGISTALGGSVTQPGETLGLAEGAPLPQGLYFFNTADWGCRNTSPTRCLGITIPIVAWSTPWTLLGARVQILTVTPFIETGVSHTAYNASVYNPALLGQLRRSASVTGKWPVCPGTNRRYEWG